MNREEAARVLEEFQKSERGRGGKVGVAIDTAIAALREPEHGYTMTADRLPDGSKIVATPDPDTGLMPCGCGGKAVVVPEDNGFYIVCDSCEVSTAKDSFFNGTYYSAQSLDDAREDWNTAMGWRGER